MNFFSDNLVLCVDLDDGSGGLGVGEVGGLAVVDLELLGDLLERVVAASPRRQLVHVVLRRRGAATGPALLLAAMKLTPCSCSSSTLQTPAMAASSTRTSNGGCGGGCSGVLSHCPTRIDTGVAARAGAGQRSGWWWLLSSRRRS